MALSESQIVALELEKVRKKLPLLYEREDSFFSSIAKREVNKVSNRLARIPLQTAPGGAFGYASFDGGDLGRGSGTTYNVATLSPVGLRIAVEINKLVEYASNSSEKAIENATKLEVVNAMKQFRRDLDAQLQTAGNGVSGNISSVAGSTFTMAATPFGARLLRVGQKVTAYDSTVTTQRSATPMTITAVNAGLGQTQTVTVDAVQGAVVGTDVLVPEGLTGASPVGLYGLPYHHNSAATGTWLSLSRSNVFTQAVMVNANSSGFAMPFARLAIDSIMQNLGIPEFEAMKQLMWFGHRSQKAALHEIAFSISNIDKKDGGQSFDLAFSDERLCGIKTMYNIHADESRLDLLNLETWGRVEYKEIDYLEIGGNTIYPVYSTTTGGVQAAYLFYLITGIQFFIDNPRAVSGITSLAVPTGY